MAEYLTNTTDLTSVANAIRTKGGTTAQLVYPSGFVSAINAIETGGSATPISPSDITFYDYDGTVVAAWTLAELATKTELPNAPTHDGLTFQSWNWSLANLKSTNRKMNVGALYQTSDDKIRIYVHMKAGRLFPVLGCCPNGTVTVDWGDGTTTNTLTGTSTNVLKNTFNHEYAKAGDYVITLSYSGSIGFLGSSKINNRMYLLREVTDASRQNQYYANCITKIEFGSKPVVLNTQAFYGCNNLTSVAMSSSVTFSSNAIFRNCTTLRFLTIPPMSSIQAYVFGTCYGLSNVAFPDNITSIASNTFYNDDILQKACMPNTVTTIGSSTFYSNTTLTEMFVPASVTTVQANTFSNCDGMSVYDFSKHTAVPTLSNVSAFNNIPSDCQIRVPSSLVDTWKAATNWSTYADQIIGV